MTSSPVWWSSNGASPICGLFETHLFGPYVIRTCISMRWLSLEWPRHGPFTIQPRSRPKATKDNHCQPKPTKAHQSPPEPTKAHQSQPKSTNAHQSQSKPTKANQSRPKPTKADRTPPKPTTTNHCQPKPTIVYGCIDAYGHLVNKISVADRRFCALYCTHVAYLFASTCMCNLVACFAYK